MEKIYYKGKIGKLKCLENIELSLGNCKHYGISRESDEFLDFLNTLNIDDRCEFIRKIEKGDSVNVNIENIIFEELIKNINRKYNEYNNCDQEIIFEIITTKNGDLYGKELHTGLLFPIVDLKKVNSRINISHIKNVIYIDDKIMFLSKNNQGEFKHNELYKFENYKCSYYMLYNAEYNRFFSKKYYYLKDLTTYTLTLIVNDFENLSLCETIIFKPKIANNNEIDAYLNKFKGFKKNIKKNNFIKKITIEYNKNVFNSEIEVKQSVSDVKKLKKIK